MKNPFSNIYRIVILITVCTVVYIEFISYVINTQYWSNLHCKNETKCLKILLVADPQLIGETNEIYHFITPLSIWDSDRYLAKTYSLVIRHLKPDVIVFLGDLFDEGSIATKGQFDRYLRRLFNIFFTEYPIKHIWLPGDNDIGGETDFVTERKVKRFNYTFSQPSVINVNHIIFTKVNRMVPEIIRSYNFNNQSQFSIVLSHMPLILVPGLFVDKVLETLKPNLIFAAHEHKPMIVQTDINQNYRDVSILKSCNNKIYDFTLGSGQIYEIIVPTCSYRMGTTEIGFGAAVIENSGIMQYTILNSPSRFKYLNVYFYLVLFICFTLLSSLIKVYKKPKLNSVTKYGYRYKTLKNGV